MPWQHWEVWTLRGRKATRARVGPSCASRQNQQGRGCLGWPYCPTLLPNLQQNGFGNRGAGSWIRHTCYFVLKYQDHTSGTAQLGTYPPFIQKKGVCAHLHLLTYTRNRISKPPALVSGHILCCRGGGGDGAGGLSCALEDVGSLSGLFPTRNVSRCCQTSLGWWGGKITPS